MKRILGWGALALLLLTAGAAALKMYSLEPAYQDEVAALLIGA